MNFFIRYGADLDSLLVYSGVMECEEWPRARTSKGYGKLTVNYKQWLAHRWVWTQAYGPIPEGMVIRHKCDNPPCVNLEHLEIGTTKDNAQDMVKRNRCNPHNASKTHCPKGHEYTEENTYLIRNRTGRMCRTCTQEKYKASYIPKSKRTHCKHGHEFTEENTYSPPKRPDQRHCRTCMKDRAHYVAPGSCKKNLPRK